MVVQSLFSAFTSVIKYEADPNNKLPEITFWLMGGLTSSTQTQVKMMLLPFFGGLTVLMLLRWKINILSFGEEEARALGVDTTRVRSALILSATLLTSASIAISGMIGWVGLIIPHLARLLVGPNYKTLIPASILLGASFLLGVDDIARTVMTFINKTLPRLLQLIRPEAKVILVGPSVPLTPLLAAYGATDLDGFCVTDAALADEVIRRGDNRSIFSAGRMVNIPLTGGGAE